jgi:hypothetical protein
MPRQIEIWFTQRAGRFYVIAEYPTSKWVGNIRSHSDVKVRVAGEEFPARARVLNQERDRSLQHEVQALSRKKYGWGDGLVIEIEPRTPQETS